MSTTSQTTTPKFPLRQRREMAREIGRQAFAAGKNSQAMGPELDELKVGGFHADDTKVMRAYLEGWTAANIEADQPADPRHTERLLAHALACTVARELGMSEPLLEEILLEGECGEDGDPFMDPDAFGDEESGLPPASSQQIQDDYDADPRTDAPD